MVEMASLIWRKLRWREARFWGKRFELLDGGVVVATLTFSGWFRYRGEAESSEGRWIFTRHGFFGHRVEVRARDSETILGVFKARVLIGGGTLELPDGRKLVARTNFWHSRYEVRTETGLELVRYTDVWRIFRMSAKVEILPGARDLPELPWLVPLVWYLVIMRHRDAAMAGAT